MQQHLELTYKSSHNQKNDHVYVDYMIMFTVTIMLLLHNHVLFVRHD